MKNHSHFSRFNANGSIPCSYSTILCIFIVDQLYEDIEQRPRSLSDPAINPLKTPENTFLQQSLHIVADSERKRRLQAEKKIGKGLLLVNLWISLFLNLNIQRKVTKIVKLVMLLMKVMIIHPQPVLPMKVLFILFHDNLQPVSFFNLKLVCPFIIISYISHNITT